MSWSLDSKTKLLFIAKCCLFDVVMVLKVDPVLTCQGHLGYSVLMVL